MAHRQFLIRYSNGFKRHISRQELDLLSASLEQIGPREYFCSASLQSDLEQTRGPSFLSGHFIFERKGKKQFEVMETPKGLIMRLRRKNVLPETLQEAPL